MPQPRDNTHLWQADTFGGLELLRAHLVEFAFVPHSHEEYMIAVTERGAALPRFWGGAQPVGRSDIFVLNPGEVHGGGPATGASWQYRSFYVPADLMQRVAHDLTGVDWGAPHFPQQVFDDPPLMALLRRAHVALEGPGSALERESRLLEAISSLIARYALGRLPVQPVGREPRAVRRAREMLDALPEENVTLERLAREAGLSPTYLSRVFRRETGLPPHAYQVLMRLRLAKGLLGEGVSIAQAAVEAGFYDQAHLTRHFKRVYGVTPGQYHAGVLS